MKGEVASWTTARQSVGLILRRVDRICSSAEIARQFRSLALPIAAAANFESLHWLLAIRQLLAPTR